MCSWVRGKATHEQALDALDDGLDQLQEEDLNLLPAESIGADISRLRRIANRCEAEATRRLRRFDKGQGYAAAGAATARAWLRWQCHLTPGAASERVGVSRQLADLPQT